MYRTEDLYLASALQDSGHALVAVWRDGSRSSFEFADSPSLQAAVADSFSGTLRLPAHSYAERIRSAKSMAVNAPARKVG